MRFSTHRFNWLLGFLLVLTGVVKAQMPEDEAARSTRLTATAQQLIDHLAHNRFTTVFASFDTQMAQAVPEDKLKSVWETIISQAGKFQNQGIPQTSMQGKMFVAVIPLAFEHASLQAKIVFDTDDKVGGLLITPDNSPAQAAPAYVMPAYAHTDRYQESELEIGTGEWKLPATLALPNGAGPFPAVVLVHGSGPHDRDETIGPNRPFRDLSAGLASLGIAVLRYEKRTKHYPEKLIADYAHLTVREETEDDALAAVRALRNTPNIDPKRIFVLGHSLGAMLAPRIASQDPSIAGLILLAAPTKPLEDMVVDQTRYIASLDGKMSDEEKATIADLEAKRNEIRKLDPKDSRTSGLMMNLPAAYWLSLRGYDPVVAATKLTMPLLILQGERDYQISIKTDFPRWRNAFAHNPKTRLNTYPALNHLFISGSGRPTPEEYQQEGHVDATVVSDIANWVLKETSH